MLGKVTKQADNEDHIYRKVLLIVAPADPSMVWGEDHCVKISKTHFGLWKGV